ncbi:sterol desaturase family protein [Lichenicola sp.]|uniref:sterol desaturase family protein n=1 Tax=Lichenicola sp. TaxID=2804529 RepID=UPI003B00DAD5
MIGILVGERRHPLRHRTHPGLPRTLRNAAMGAASAAVVALVETPVTRWIARGNIAHRRGLGQHLPGRLGVVASFLAMDYGFYLWHVATHRLTFLWRFHRVHHVDPDMDMSTAIRFHLLDMLVSLPWRMLQVRASGIGPSTLAAWQRFFTLSILFHHSNLGLPPDWDRRLSWVLTTPRMHGIHHSVRAAQRDSNWSSGFSVWDRLHRTLRQDVPPTAIIIGIDDPAALSDVTLGQALLAPFRPMPSPERHA